MPSLKNYWETRTFKKKLIITFMPLVLIPMIFLTVLSSWIYSNQITKSMDNNVVNTVNLVNEHLDTYLDELTRLSVLPYYNSQILNIMQQTGNIGDSDFKLIQGLLSQAIRNPREDLQSVSIYRRDGQIFTSSLYDVAINYQYDFKSSPWYKKAIASNGKVVFTGKVNDSRIINRPEPAFSVVRAIKIYNGPILGVIIIDVNFTGLESIFKPVDLGKDSNIIVLDDHHQNIYSKNNRYMEALPNIDASNDRIQDIKTASDKLIVHHIDSADTGWKIVGMVSESEMNQGKAILYKTILTVMALIVLVIVIVSVLLSDTITKPLKTLRMLMGKVEKGDFNVAYHSLNGNLEISLVGRAFNKMNQKIDELINQVLEIRFKQKEAELNNLKLQIRPHFLFNNLEAIRALAEIGDREGIVEITSALGGMLRYSLNKQDSKVELRDEIHQIRNYLKIEQIRSGDSLIVDYDLDQELLNCMTIPILLQPVVENCIHHGFDQVNGPKKIKIAVQPYESGIFIMVQDNGTGMTASDQMELNAYLADEAAELTFGSSGIGLKNLHSRIQLEYGPLFGLTIISEYGEGMTVQIKIPRVELRTRI
ncbi:sensor histidine kinase [Paenibacillus sepulcri]|uniref:histidine kinase n=1 Tax=Paenibacillus sepulcri TaxID=359917 RepID=A0ABS7BV64_9BACL|nr:histidine kinase [Paenibacillus sepulcri]